MTSQNVECQELQFQIREFQTHFSDEYLDLVFSLKFLSGEYHNTSLIISQHWLRQWLGAARQQTITWANVDPDLWRHMASLGDMG